MKIDLLGDRLLVKLDPLRVISEGGIHYPNQDCVTEGDIHVWGTVLSVGNGRMKTKHGVCLGERIPLTVKVGDRVMVQRFLRMTESNKHLRQHYIGEDCLIVEEKDVICVETTECED